MKPPHRFFTDESVSLKAGGLWRALRLIRGAQGPEVTLDGRSVVLLCSNNYLGLAGDPLLGDALIEGAGRYGMGSGASRLVSGNMEAHEELESRIARFKGTESALVFSSGWHANVGALQALAGPGNLVLSDELNHASIVDGCRLSRAEIAVYPHCDLGALESALRRSAHPRRLIVTESLFSMDGDVAPLREISGLADRYGALLMVDEAHATGVFGDGGRGIVEQLGLRGRVDVQMGTLGKALGCYGAYIAGGRDLIEYLMNRARSFIFTTALPPALCAAASCAVGIVERDEWRRERLRENVRHITAGLKDLGMVPGGSPSQIIPLLIGDEGRTMEVCARLLEEGVYCQGIRPPSVPPGTSRLRMTVMATHTRAHLDTALAAMGKILPALAPGRPS